LNDCPAHQGQDTMVPCLGCGRSFCRICDPPSGAGQYCPACHKEQVALLAGKSEKKSRSKVSKAAEKAEKADEPEPSSNTRQAARQAGRKAASPFLATGRAFKAAGRGIKKAAVFTAGLPKRGALGVVKGLKWGVAEVRDRFPVDLEPRELLEGEPPLKENWLKLAVVVLSGAAVWTIVVAVAQVRHPGMSMGVSVLVAGGVVWALGSRYGLKVAVFTAGFALIALVFGEVLAQLLFRAHVIKKVNLDKPSTFYSTFAFRMIVLRMLPAAAIAFLIGWWPLSRRLGWVGFSGSKGERPEKPGAPVGSDPGGAVRCEK
jgi:hypothetical protein